MKKIIALALTMLIVISFAGCSMNKPDKVIDSFCNAIKTYDFDTAATYMQNSDEFPRPNNELKIEEDVSLEQLMTYFKDNAAKMTYSLGESKIDGDTAIVSVSFTHVDASNVADAALGEFLPQAFALSFSGIDDDKMTELFSNIFTEKIKSIEPKTMTSEVNFSCVKVDKGWKITKFSDDDSTKMENIITSNIDSAFKDLGESFNDSPSENKDNEDIIWHDIPLGQEVELATIKIKITECEEKQELKNDFFKPDIAQEGTKYIVLKVAIENITKETIDFNNDLLLTDGAGRSYKPYDDAMDYFDETFMYTDLAPNITKEGFFVYNVPTDSSDSFITIYKAGTKDGYRLYFK